MLRKFIFCHGFGFNRGFWKNLAPYFEGEWCDYLDLGYFGGALIPDGPGHDGSADQAVTRIGIGHSLGLLKLLSSGQSFTHLIGLNGFTNFLGYGASLRERRGGELASMKRQLEECPLRTLQRFYRRCGLPDGIDLEWERLEPDRVSADLACLERDFTVPLGTSLLIIGARDDVVVPPDLLADNLAHGSQFRLECLDEGRHGLGFLKAASVRDHIMSFIHDSL